MSETTAKTPVELWVEALRSGEYEQTHGHLHDEYGFCCLGVACDLFARFAGGPFWEEDEWGDLTYLGSESVLPEKVRQWLGLRSHGGEYDDDTLYKHNDQDEMSFAEIAGIVESRPPGLFAE